MLPQNFYAQLASKNYDLNELVAQAARHPEMIDDLLAGLAIDQAATRYGCDKILRAIARDHPAALYPHFDFIAANLASEKTFLKWGAIDILSNLAAVDCEGKFEKIFDRFFRPITGPIMITAANIARGAAQIALAKPELADRIAGQLLKVEKGKYQTEKCRQIVIGQAIKSFGLMFEHIKRPRPIIEFVGRQTTSPRPSTKNYAEKFLKKYA